MPYKAENCHAVSHEQYFLETRFLRNFSFRSETFKKDLRI